MLFRKIPIFFVWLPLCQAIADHRLYVLRFPFMDNITVDPTANSAFRGQRFLSPIALFVATENRSAPIKPVAIQLDNQGE